MLLVNDKYIYIHFPKTGGSFVKKCLRELGCAKSVLTKHSCPIELEIISKYNSLPKVTSIRNPWDWYVSLWAFRNSQKKAHMKNTDKRHMVNIWPFWDSFDVFIRSVLDDSLGKAGEVIVGSGSHCSRPIGEMLDNDIGLYSLFFNHFCYLNGKEYIFNYMRTENLASDIVRSFGLTKQQARDISRCSKVNTSQHKYYKKYYSKETRKLVAHKDRHIIKKFGYNF